MGSTQNKGIELALNAVLIDRRDYSMQFSFNIAMNRNKVLDLGGLDRIEAYSSWASTQIDYDFVVTPGQSLGQIWGYVSDGRYPASDFTWTGSSWQANEGVLDNSHIAGNGWGPGAVRFCDLGGDRKTPIFFFVEQDQKIHATAPLPEMSNIHCIFYHSFFAFSRLFKFLYSFFAV